MFDVELPFHILITYTADYQILQGDSSTKPVKDESRPYFKLWRITGDHIGRMDSLFLNAWIDSVSSWPGTRNAIPDALPFAKSAFIWQLKTIQMKRLGPVLTVLLAFLISACDDNKAKKGPSAPLVRCHFVGMKRVNADTNALHLNKVWALQSSQELRKLALDKIAKTPFQLWHKNLPPAAVDQPSLIRPLLEDLIDCESYVELRGAEADYDSVLAIRLENDRSRLWNTNLWQLIVSWKLSPPQTLRDTQIQGWDASGKGIAVRLQQKGDWLLIGWSLGKLSRIGSLAATLEKSDRPVSSLTNHILQWHGDLPTLRQWSPILSKYKLPPIDVAVSARDAYIRTEARVALANPLSWRFQSWKIPTNLISEPLVSFSVAQGIEPLLRALPGVTDLGLDPIPSQVCGWAQATAAFKSYWAFPVSQPTNVLREITPKVPSLLKHHIPQPPGDLMYVTNDSELLWRGLPYVVPFLKAAQDTNSDYLVIGLFPLDRQAKPAPAEVLSQVSGQTNLLYYHWEFTQQRLLQFKRIYQVLDMAHLRTMPSPNDASVKWLKDAPSTLGNTVTEVRISSANELKVLRKSHCGFSAFELATILRWIDSPAFPLGYSPPARVQTKSTENPTRP
jgi:hypothetical protein